MKKTIAALMLSLMFVACGGKKTTPPPPPPPPVNKDFTVTLKWNEDFTNVPKCSGSVTKGCVSGFTVGYTAGTSQTFVPLPNPNVPLTACTAGNEPEPCQYVTNSQLPLGTVTWSVSAMGIDSNGAVVSATSTGNTTAVTLPSPTNVQGSIAELVMPDEVIAGPASTIEVVSHRISLR